MSNHPRCKRPVNPTCLPVPPNVKDLAKEPPFGGLTAIGYAGKSASGQACWWCRCFCGRTVSVRAVNLTSGHTKSCGCLRHASPAERKRLLKSFAPIRPRRRTSKPFTPEEREDVCRLARDGKDVPTIAGLYGRHTATVYLVLKRAGITPVNTLFKLSAEQKDDICRRYQTGESVMSLARMFDINESGVRSLLARRGIPIRRRVASPKAGRRPCHKCGVRPHVYRGRHCRVCRKETERRQQRDWRRSHIAKGLCPLCGEPSDRPGKNCSACHAKYLERTRQLKRQAIDAYGGRCACCGEDVIELLTIDHVNNDGTQRRKAGVYRGGQSTYRWLIRHGFPDSYQCLCFSCNWGKRVNGGVCPHQSRKATRADATRPKANR